ncbi:hypothetical protein [Agromyces larvae]|uniref:DUF222 domain-containing protein n=1 Tax=Agromyces larvae TaxID=2929802 RepID=A0ABY4C369_9MICO|nr:hypothetical protein [Agromyces larvae]UOE45923.1 hypothetical protein MTO99_09340 [Agromyces larvae]
MAEYTPTTDALRDLWVDHLLNPLPRAVVIELVPEVQAAFDRLLASELAAAERRGAVKALDRVRAELRVEAMLHAGAFTPNEVFAFAATFTPEWFDATQIEQEAE